MNRTTPPPAGRPRRRGTAALLAAALLAALAVSAPAPARSEPAWQDTDTGLPKAAGTRVRMELDRGRPRVLYWTSYPVGDLRFAWCDGGCHDESSWHSTRVLSDVDHQGADLAVDAWGRVHIAYLDEGRQAIYYARCDSGCGSPGGWVHAKVDDTNAGGGFSLAVDPWGRPRLAYSAGPEVRFTYAACNEDCTSEGGWSRVRVLREQRGGYPSLALDGVKPRIAFDNWDEVRYLSCETRCLERSSWRETPVAGSPDGGFHPPSLVVEGDRAHIAFNSPENSYVAYVRCEADCSNSASWSEPVIVAEDRAVPLLAVVEGRPRIAYVHSVLNAENPTAVHYENHIPYAWCDTGCAPSSGSNANWNARVITEFGASPALTLDGERPRVAYVWYYGNGTEPEGLRFASCGAACGSPGTWLGPPSSPPPADDPPPSSSPTTSPLAPGSSGSSMGGGPGGSGGGGTGATQGGRGPDDNRGGVGPAGSPPGGSAEAAIRDSAAANGGRAAAGSTDEARRRGASRSDGRSAGDGAGSGGGSVGDVARSVARAPGAAIDLITNPTKALSWPWGRISLSALALFLLAAVGRMTYLEAAARYDRWRRGALTR